MSDSFDYEEFKAQAIEQLQVEVLLSGKDGVGTAVGNLLNSTLGKEMDIHMEDDGQECVNRRNDLPSNRPICFRIGCQDHFLTTSFVWSSLMIWIN